MHGREHAKVCREAGVLWNEPTTDGYPNMRAKINAELACVEEEFNSGGLTWCESDVKRLISPYPAHKKTDDVLAQLGEDFHHDSVHRFDVQQHAIAAGLPADAAGEDAAGLPAVAAGEANAQKEADGSSDDEDESNDEREDFSTTAVASDAVAVKAACEEPVPLALTQTSKCSW